MKEHDEVLLDRLWTRFEKEADHHGVRLAEALRDFEGSEAGNLVAYMGLATSTVLALLHVADQERAPEVLCNLVYELLGFSEGACCLSEQARDLFSAWYCFEADASRIEDDPSVQSDYQESRAKALALVDAGH